MSSDKRQIMVHEITSILICLCLLGSSMVLVETSDWLITKGKGKIEVESYYIEGDMVIMRLRNGQLAQIAWDKIDWLITMEVNQRERALAEIRIDTQRSQERDLSAEPQIIEGDEKKYSGEPVTLEFKDADIRDVLHLFAQITGFNFVIDPQVAGRTSIWLKDVPWDQALEVILRNSNLAMVVEGNIYRIATLQKLTEEEAARRKLAEERFLASPVITIVRRISYAKASEMAAIIKRFLSPRGEVIVDERTNTLIIRDIAKVIGEIEAELKLEEQKDER